MRTDYVELLCRCRRAIGGLIVEIERGPRAELGLAKELLDDLTREINAGDRRRPAVVEPVRRWPSAATARRARVLGDYFPDPIREGSADANV